MIMFDRNKELIINDNPKSPVFDEILDDLLVNGEHDFRDNVQPPASDIKGMEHKGTCKGTDSMG